MSNRLVLHQGVSECSPQFLYLMIIRYLVLTAGYNLDDAGRLDYAECRAPVGYHIPSQLALYSGSCRDRVHVRKLDVHRLHVANW